MIWGRLHWDRKTRTTVVQKKALQTCQLVILLHRRCYDRFLKSGRFYFCGFSLKMLNTFPSIGRFGELFISPISNIIYLVVVSMFVSELSQCPRLACLGCLQMISSAVGGYTGPSKINTSCVYTTLLSKIIR